MPALKLSSANLPTRPAPSPSALQCQTPPGRSPTGVWRREASCADVAGAFAGRRVSGLTQLLVLISPARRQQPCQFNPVPQQLSAGAVGRRPGTLPARVRLPVAHCHYRRPAAATRGTPPPGGSPRSCCLRSHNRQRLLYAMTATPLLRPPVRLFQQLSVATWSTSQSARAALLRSVHVDDS